MEKEKKVKEKRGASVERQGEAGNACTHLRMHASTHSRKGRKEKTRSTPRDPIPKKHQATKSTKATKEFTPVKGLVEKTRLLTGS